MRRRSSDGPDQTVRSEPTGQDGPSSSTQTEKGILCHLPKERQMKKYTLGEFGWFPSQPSATYSGCEDALFLCFFSISFSYEV